MNYHVIGLIPFIPILGAFSTPITYLLLKDRKAVFAHGMIFSLVTLVLTIIALDYAYTSDLPIMYLMGGWPAPLGITYTLDKLTALLMLVTALVMTVVITYSVEYITDEGYPWYITLLLGAYSGMLGVIATSDVFNLFVMLEVTGVSSYGLVMYYRSKAGSIVSGLKYAFIGAMGTTLYLLALAIVYNTYGTLNLIDISLKTHGYPGSYISSGQAMYDAVSIGVIMGLAFWTFSIKSGVFPNHFWLPDAHPAAPAPVSAMLSGLVVNTGAVGLFKILYLIYGGSIMENLVPVRNTISLLVVSMGAISALVGSLLMLIQDDVKRLIAYSTVMNTGYIFMSIGVLSTSGILAFLYHTVIHSLAKSTLFLGTGVLVKYAGSRRMDDLAGLGKKHLLPGLAIGISVFTLAGIPPLPGFLSKLLMYEAFFEYNPVFAIVMIIASAIGLLAYMRLFFTVLLEAPGKERAHRVMPIAEASTAAMGILLLLLGILFITYPDAFNTVFNEAVNQLSNVVDYMSKLSSSLI